MCESILSQSLTIYKGMSDIDHQSIARTLASETCKFEFGIAWNGAKSSLYSFEIKIY